MAEIDFQKLREDFTTIGEVFRELERTVLFGWPHKEFPTETQGKAIMSVYHELSIQGAIRLPDSDRWYLSGQIVARIERDAKE